VPTIPVLLSFDDGPHGAAAAANHTVKIVDTLNTQGIVAAFFIQPNVKHRMGTGAGLAAVKHANGPVGSERHVIGIHTGSDTDHEAHWKRERAGKLRGDMAAAKVRIFSAIGHVPLTVRAVGFELSNPKDSPANRTAMEARVRAAYAAESLRHIGCNLNSFDNTLAKWRGAKVKRRPRSDEVRSLLREGVADALKGGPRELVVLFHDINGTTADNLPAYITAIADGVTAWSQRTHPTTPYTAQFLATRTEVEQLLASTAIDTDQSWMIPKKFLTP
jgi:peptidoglycan/xylan/chitin deacetylase (PgdA/CDA1 family)